MIAIPLSVGVAVFTTEMCPTAAWDHLLPTELLAAIPSVISGWGIFVLVPLVRTTWNPGWRDTLGWTTLFSGPPLGIGMLAAGIILAIMIIPIISSIRAKCSPRCRSSSAKRCWRWGATRWEMIRVGVLRNARTGIVGAIILGLGRALGETMAVTMVIGNRPRSPNRCLRRATPWPA